MTPAVLLTTLDAVLAARSAGGYGQKEHRERLQLVRDLLGLVITVRKLPIG